MRVLVTAASKHGATEEIAERIGAVLAAHGVEVEVKKLQDVSGLAGYEAVVLGSGIYLGKWLKEARRFVEVHAAELAQRPTWLFASGSIMGDPPVGDDPNAMGAGLVERLVQTTQARELKRVLFANATDVELDSAGRVMVPPRYREHAGIDRDVVITGAGDCLELWDAATWATYDSDLIERAPDLTAGLGHPA